MTAYYNEIDPYAAQWLRNLIDAGHIARGDVDERSIVDVRASDLAGYGQCHFFAGIGGWSVALRLAGWPDDRPVWTGSCPCQPFSAAGAGKAADDERHLWPAWFPLIAQRRPAIVFGEQVEAAIGWGWLDAVFADLEGEGYACGTSVLPACGVGAPHIRQRTWFVADADGGDASTARLQRGGEHGQQPQDCDAVRLADAGHRDRTAWLSRGKQQGAPTVCKGPASDGEARELGDARGAERDGPADRGSIGAAASPSDSQGHQSARRSQSARTGATRGFWSDAEWIACTDGKSRPVGPGSFPLGHGIQRRPSKLRAYGNAIVPQVAAAFIIAATEAMTA